MTEPNSRDRALIERVFPDMRQDDDGYWTFRPSALSRLLAAARAEAPQQDTAGVREALKANPAWETEVDAWCQEARDDGYREGQNDATGVHTDFWRSVMTLMEQRGISLRDYEPEGMTAQDALDWLLEHERECLSALPQQGAEAPTRSAQDAIAGLSGAQIAAAFVATIEDQDVAEPLRFEDAEPEVRAHYDRAAIWLRAALVEGLG